ncbi:MAG: amidohydrolase family protein [Bacteroidota bacterium]
MRFIQADKIFDGRKFLDSGATLVLDAQNRLQEIIYNLPSQHPTIEFYSGLLCPGFVNAHCHLELSHFFDAIPQHSGLPAFAKKVVQLRPGFSKELALEQMQIWDHAMCQNGIVAVGDICNDAASFGIKQHSKIYYHSFIEVIGLNPSHAEKIFNSGLQLYHQLINLGLHGSLAPHAPYSVSKQLVQLIADFNASLNGPTSIHNQESEEEEKFMLGEKSGFDDLYQFLNIDLSWRVSPKMNGIKLFDEALKKGKWLLVHNTFTNAKDLATTNHPDVFYCFCPNANLYIENQLPLFNLFKSSGSEFCLGTDSLASNHHLDMIAEMNVLKTFSDFSDEQILKAATANGAKALGVSKEFGTLMPQKNTGLNQIQLHNNTFKFIKKIT